MPFGVAEAFRSMTRTWAANRAKDRSKARSDRRADANSFPIETLFITLGELLLEG